MAVVRNITADDLSLFRSDAPPARAGDEVEISDETFVDRAWPKSTWELVQKPGKGFRDDSTDDAYIFSGEPEEEQTIPQLRELAAAKGVDLTGITKKADIIAAIESAPADDSEESA